MVLGPQQSNSMTFPSLSSVLFAFSSLILLEITEPADDETVRLSACQYDLTFVFARR